jgi:urocanate hydratase
MQRFQKQCLLDLAIQLSGEVCPREEVPVIQMGSSGWTYPGFRCITFGRLGTFCRLRRQACFTEDMRLEGHVNATSSFFLGGAGSSLQDF